VEHEEEFHLSDVGSPAMSVVLATERYETIRKTVRHLRAQKVRDRLEIVIVTPSKDKLGLQTSELNDFLKFLVVEIGAIRSLSWARAVGIRQASAPLVALAESHSYPDPGWAEALIEAHRKPWAAVGPAIGNANPAGMISWCNLFLDYGRWVEMAEAKVMDDLPGRNSSYKRSLLLQYGSELEAMLEAEIVLHLDLQARGYKLYLEPKAKTYHLNVSLPSSWLAERFNAGRWYAAARAQSWPWLRRFLYIGGAPLIPLVRLRRILGDIKRSGRDRDLLPRILPVLLVSLIVSAVGEMVGYAFGVGAAMQKTSLMELYKAQHLTEHDRQAEAS
jgi:glycosyltransferase involved in cell wall biosynthesis